MIRLALPLFLVVGAVAAGLAAASERHEAHPVQRSQMASLLSMGELAAMTRAETIDAPGPWVSPKPTVVAISPAMVPVAHAPRWVPLPPRRADGL